MINGVGQVKLVLAFSQQQELGVPHKRKARQMALLTIQEVRNTLKSEKIVFMKQGTGKIIHISSENGLSDYNNLLHGVTYSRRGTRNSSKNHPAYIEAIDTDSICKKCLEKVGA